MITTGLDAAVSNICMYNITGPQIIDHFQQIWVKSRYHF